MRNNTDFVRYRKHLIVLRREKIRNSSISNPPSLWYWTVGLLSGKATLKQDAICIAKSKIDDIEDSLIEVKYEMIGNSDKG